MSKFVTTRQAAEMLGVLPTSINNLIYGKKIRGIKVGRDWLVFESSLKKYLASKSKRGRPTSGTPTIEIYKKVGRT